MYKITYSKQAKIDIEDVIDYIAKESAPKVLAYLKSYEDKIKLLRLNPYMGVECKNKRIKRECRILVHKSHIIIYKINESTEDIFLVRIYHGAADYANKYNARNKNY